MQPIGWSLPHSPRGEATGWSNEPQVFGFLTDGPSAPTLSKVKPALSQIGRYRIEEKIGTGGMATVYRGVLQGIDGFEREVAIKVLHAHLADEPQYVAMFHDEARLASQLAHPVLVPVTDLGDANGIHYMVMDLLKGEDLAALHRHFTKKDKPFPVPHALWVAQHVLEGLSYAHELKTTRGKRRGIIHRDVSPQNIFISRAGVVRLVDFGIAREQQGTGITQAGIVKGTIPYMAPEQARGEAVDERIDVFAVGMVLFELVTGHIPLVETEPTAQREAIANGRLTPEFKSIDASIRPILEKALATNVDERYASARDFAHDVHALLEKMDPHHDPLTLGAMVRRRKTKPAVTKAAMRPDRRAKSAANTKGRNTRSQRPRPNRSGAIRIDRALDGGKLVAYTALLLLVSGLIYTFVSGVG
jgi:serine/threonine protein kinase